ncbi:vWA domain-containing protein [Chryseobacterium sp. SL1]|uniref:vWA domain-containing protein n=1 Tax=Chryseobacterium sp. SL1 TaxID=2995159 RepID=UPI002273DE1F|nr:vWA domain-containing protein [Chryseobacterium sp. SL1]MCY1660923.1 VWA domain-containing protein [Chryseobacterium sp. SL1]
MKNKTKPSHWICSTHKSHIFTTPTHDFFCDQCPPYTGVLIESYPGDKEPEPQPENSIQNAEVTKTGVGLYIFLVDSSASMFDGNAFPNVRQSRAEIVSAQIAGAIFQMSAISRKDDAYLFVLLFDHKLKPFINFMTLQQVFDKYSTAEDLQAALYREMQGMNGATDINLALKTAYHHTQKFVNGEMESIGSIKPMFQTIYNPITLKDITIPNVRCLILTDGEQYTAANGINRIEENPFERFEFEGRYVNILMGAYNGSGNDGGCQELKAIMSKCPIHNEPQFFLFDNAHKIGDMYKLFRMASGPSGFCPKCLENLVIRDKTSKS